VSAIDAAQLDLMFTELRMPSAKAMWQQLAERADKEGWPAARLLAALAEQEIADRARRRFERHLAEAKLRRWPTSSSTSSPWSPGPMSTPWPPATAGSTRGPT